MNLTGLKRLAAHRWSMLYLLPLLIQFSACSTSDSKPAAISTPPPIENLQRESATRSPSAMEALSRGVAAITPPGAALKDIYFEFDSTSLQAAAKDILTKNAEWMKANPSARVEVEG